MLPFFMGEIMTGRITGNLIEVRQGDSFIIYVDVKNRCKPVDLTDANLMMQVRDKNDNIVFQANGEAVDILNGKMALIITPEMTSAELGDYETDIQLATADGSINTIFPENVNAVGVFRITKQVTRG